ncbi:MAG: hypothetical protein JW912_07445, partial [Sedimentisphaerales bacterium]|nr:hypothetical protein [Sedimentisphaerales bacterium]
MTDDPGIRLIRTTVLFAIFVSSVIPVNAASPPLKKGSFTATFKKYSPFSDTESLSKRMRISMERGADNDHHYNIERESFEVYMPESYDPNTSFGLLVWISPSPDGNIKHCQGSKELMDKHKLIWIGANNSGNQEDVNKRRIPLALDAAYNMQKLYNIDRDRVYVAGLSGGGRVASITAFHHSDVYDGGIFIIGANCWVKMAVPGQDGFWNAGCTKPRQGFLVRAKKFGRYVLLTGDTDGNRLQMHTY